VKLAPVSVIIPAFNAAGLIGEAIDTVLQQTRRPQQIIVVDDGSTDATHSVVAKFPEASYLVQGNSGAAQARNLGARYVASPFMCFLDADDLWPSDRIERLLSCLETDPMLDIVCGSMVQFRRDRDGKMVELSKPLACHLPSVMLMRTDVFRKVGPFSGKWRVGETIEWVSRAVDAGVRRGSIADVVLLRRVHEQNLGKVVSASSHEYLQMLREVMVRRRGHPNFNGGQRDVNGATETPQSEAER